MIEEEHIAGHTGKQILVTEKYARFIARHNNFKKSMRAYPCYVGGLHWHVTSMSKGRYVTNKRKDPKKVSKASDIAK